MANVNAGTIEAVLRLRDELSSQMAVAQASLAQLGKSAAATATQTGTLEASLGTLTRRFIGPAAIAALVTSAATSAFQYADELQKLADKTGIGAEALQILSAAAKGAGNDLPQVTSAISMMQRRLSAGDDSLLRALDELQISFGEFRTLSPDQQFIALGQAIATVKDPADRARLATQAFGRAGTEVLPTLTSDFKAVGEATATMSREAVATLDATGDALVRLKDNVKAFAGESIAALIRTAIVRPLEDIRTLEEAGLLEPTLKRAAALATLPPAPPIFKDFVPPGIPKDLDAIVEKLEAEQVVAHKAAVETDKHAQALMTLRETLGGDGVIRRATDYVTVLGEIGGIATLTEGEQRQINEALDAALEKYRLLGREAPAEMLKIWAATAQGPALTRGIGAIVDAFKTLPAEVLPVSRDIGTAMTAELLKAPTALGQALSKPSLFAGFGKTISTQLGPTILAAVTGGGSVVKGVGSLLGGQLGTNVVSKFGSTITGALGTAFGGAINAILPGVGALLGPLMGKIGGFFKNIFGGGEHAKVNDLRDKFIAAAGGLHELNVKAQAAGLTLDRLLAATKVTDFEAAVKQLTGAFGLQDEATQALEDAVRRYGFTIEELGPKFRQQKLDELAQGLLKDYGLLIASGIENDTVLRKMATSFQELALASLQTGAAIPEHLRAPLQRMVELGLLTDAAGTKLTDLEGLTFAETLSEGFTRVVEAIKALTAALTGGVVPGFDEVRGRMNQTPWEEWARRGTGAIGDVSEELDQLEFGASPGGLKELPILMARAEASMATMRGTLLEGFTELGGALELLLRFFSALRDLIRTPSNWAIPMPPTLPAAPPGGVTRGEGGPHVEQALMEARSADISQELRGLRRDMRALPKAMADAAVLAQR